MKTNTMMIHVILALLFIQFFGMQANALVPERRNGQDSEEFGWMLAPAPMRIEGIGEAVPVFALLSNFYETTDIFGAQTLDGGDFKMKVAYLRQFPLFTRHIQLSGARFKIEMPFMEYHRGMNSGKDDYIQPFIQQDGTFAEVKLHFLNKRLELFYQQMKADATILEVYDRKGNLLASPNTAESFTSTGYGWILDLTDDYTDPRKGIRMGRKVKPQLSNYEFISDIETIDSNLSLFFPVAGKDTLILNAFRSTSTVTRQGVVDGPTARAILDQGCDIALPTYAECKASEDQQVADFLAYNQFGQATALGGENRLRAYPLGRFKAGNTSYQAIEYRMNFAENPKFLNFLFFGGQKTLLQMAFFYEQGAVNDNVDDLHRNMRSSAGLGFRAIISGFVYRMDMAQGDEGSAVNLVFEYPMALNPMAE